MGKIKRSFLTLLICIISASGCKTAAQHQQSLSAGKEREMTVGIVQREIRAGMSQAEVAEALGSPNIVTKDRNDDETWIYDKIATEASYSQSSGGIGAGGGAMIGTVLTLGLANYSERSGAASSTQKTLTVIIKFDEGRVVKSFSYHSSKF